MEGLNFKHFDYIKNTIENIDHWSIGEMTISKAYSDKLKKDIFKYKIKRIYRGKFYNSRKIEEEEYYTIGQSGQRFSYTELIEKIK